MRVQEKTQGLKNTEIYVDHYHHKITEKFMNKMIISWDIYFYEDFYFFLPNDKEQDGQEKG